MKILIVEDNFKSRKILVEFLEGYGQIDIAVNGHEALQAFELGLEENAPYELMLLDIMMPQMDGHETLEAVREIEKKRRIFTSDGIKIIMITALVDGKNIMHAFRQGCEHYITKPFRKEALLDALRKLEMIP